MSGLESYSLASFAFVVPPFYGAVGAWLSRLGTSDGAWDEFFSTWPFVSIGSFVGAVSFINLIH
jgi:hypothetical protein